MIYLNQQDLLKLGKNWHALINMIEQSIDALADNDFAQPMKPYLRYRTMKNRIIAMPAFIGGKISMAGIKWIAGFPENITQNIPRAHSITILNQAETGIPVCIINTAVVSGLRTAAVTGYVLTEYVSKKNTNNLNVGITGFGPIGKLHLEMLLGLFDSKIKSVSLFDLRPIDTNSILETHRNKIIICNKWEDAYDDADVFITCTVSEKPYIDKPPKNGSLHLNVSLRDYLPEFKKLVDVFIVDDWDQVCKENTDIENMHKLYNLQKSDTFSIQDIRVLDIFGRTADDDIIMFNPMGMGIFDVAIATYYFQLAKEFNIGTVLTA